MLMSNVVFIPRKEADQNLGKNEQCFIQLTKDK